VIPWANYCVKCQEQIEVEKQMEDLDERSQELVSSE